MPLEFLILKYYLSFCGWFICRKALYEFEKNMYIRHWKLKKPCKDFCSILSSRYLLLCLENPSAVFSGDSKGLDSRLMCRYVSGAGVDISAWP